ncbi:MAG: Hpt domain-containing protein [Verrucomicrobiae bacterium]|jgi:HPt (histidine-containing phosphotransfer) domain-containing protein|nr:Hpt domain-containing protein [Verrucomicrobiae bacterium]
MDPAERICDRARLLDEYHGEEDLLRRVIDAFDREYVDRMSRIRAAVDRGDHWNLSRESHAFKGSVSTFFARAAFAAARRMEEDHDLSNAPANIVLFEREVI